jgi:hypothetical protein
MTHCPLCSRSCTWVSAKSLAPSHPLRHLRLKSKSPSPPRVSHRLCLSLVTTPPSPQTQVRGDLLADAPITHANTHVHACKRAHLAIRYVIPCPTLAHGAHAHVLALNTHVLTLNTHMLALNTHMLALNMHWSHLPSTPTCTPLMHMQDSHTQGCQFREKRRLLCPALTHSLLVKLTSSV